MINIPTLAQLYTGILSKLEAEFQDSIPLFAKNVLRVEAAVQAAKLKLAYLTLGRVQKNIFVDTADPESTGGTLERFGRVKLNRGPFAAVAGQYLVVVTGSIGVVIPATTQFKADDTSSSPGKKFVLDVTKTLTATTDYITLRAMEAGQDSQLTINDTLTCTVPLANVERVVTVYQETVVPLASEDLEDYRRKALDSYRTEPQGGAATDYRLWSSDAQGVEEVYPYARTGYAGEINVYVEATIADSTDGKGTPSQSILDDVADVIEFDPDTSKPLNERGRRPLGVFDVHIIAVTIKEIDIQITSFSGIDSDIEDEIFAAIEAALSTKRPFVAGADILADRNDVFDTNNIISIILNTRPGSVFGAVQLTVAGDIVPTYTFVDGNIPHLNSITYV